MPMAAVVMPAAGAAAQLQPPAALPAPRPAALPAAAPAPDSRTLVRTAAQGAPGPAAQHSPSTPPDAAGFRAWVEAFMPEAAAAGISAATLQATLGRAQFLPQVLQLDRAQPEFTRPPWVYLDGALSRERVAEGRTRQRTNASALNAAAARYGVPASIVVAIWGMESDFGRNFGNFRTIDALATLAYEGRRAEWARKELLAALRIAQTGEIRPDALKGSWAGAMGHTQFLPSVFLEHAVDADGDARRDIWASVPDVVASTANFLAHSGWAKGQPWGVEVRLPADFDYARAELTTRQDSSAWAAEGVRAWDGSALPSLPGASILAPAGARGPAVLVGPNFRALLRYNNSVSYALAVALLAQQIDGGTGLQAPWPRDLKPLSRSEVLELQQGLNARGLDAGVADGVLGPATRAGVRRLQQSLGLPADGYATGELLRRLQGL
ncbi:lytic murein transglycosylase [Melaminivora jejuensis]|uniref:lytic murein transglycosylase n=1 Tax=Melaminivora jejuensis TaxID=1267217 RepID=UPI001ADF9302